MDAVKVMLQLYMASVGVAHATEMFSVAKRDEALEKAARAEIDAIKKANAARQ